MKNTGKKVHYAMSGNVGECGKTGKVTAHIPLITCKRCINTLTNAKRGFAAPEYR